MAIFRKKKKVMSFFNTETGDEINNSDDFKNYLLLLKDIDSDETDGGEWYPFTGRQTLYDFLYSQLGNWDLLNSYIITGNLKLGEEISVYTFLRYSISENKIDQSSKPLEINELNLFVERTLDEEELEKIGEELDVKLETIYTKELNRMIS